MLQPRDLRRRVAAVCAVGLGVGLVPMVAAAPAANAAATELFFSEYIEGSSNNKALEIFNGTGAPIDLGSDGYNVQMFFNGNTNAGLTINLTGSVADGDVFVVAHSSAFAEVLDQADQTNGSGWFNGDDAVVLRKGTNVIDSIGQIGFDPGSQWGTGLTSTADNTLRRKDSVEAGDTDPFDEFVPAVEWDGFAQNDFDGLGRHPGIRDRAPDVAATIPFDNWTHVGLDKVLTVTFNEPVAVTDDAFSLSCADSGSHEVTVAGGPTTFTVDAVTDFGAGEACTLQVSAAHVTDLDTEDPPDAMATDHFLRFTTVPADACQSATTTIPEIQGDGPEVTTRGSVRVEGIVVGDYEGASSLRGFYVQAAEGDGNPATSDAIFVFEPSDEDLVAVGDRVLVVGRAGEYQGQSQISLTGDPVPCGTGSVEPAAVSFPVENPTTLERYEGMLVTVPQTMTVTEHFQLGRFGQVVVSSDGRLDQPTNVVAPGDEALALQAANNLRRLIIDDASQRQNPDPIPWGRDGQPLSADNTLRGGDTVTGAVGVMTYTWAGNSASGNAYRLRPIGALDGVAEFEAANERPESVPEVGGRIQVAGMNVLNYFNTWDGRPDEVNNCTFGVGGPPADCRGADDEFEFERQATKTVEAIVGMGAEVVGVVEIENDGYGPDSALADLVDRLNAATEPGTWGYVDVDERTGQVNALGTDAIKVGVIYQRDAVVPMGDTAVLNTEEFVTGGDSEERNRPALAQAFVEKGTGGSFVAVVNHLKSKGSACDTPAANDGQGNCNDVRVTAAGLLADWLASDPTGTSEQDTLIIGDLNSYAMEDPITLLKGAGYTDLIREYADGEENPYSYVFDGQWGYLDHAMGTASLAAQVTGVAEWHVNADEPSVLDYNTDFKSAGQVESLYAPDEFRNSDHDPVIVGLDLTPGNNGKGRK
ncbi:ExeM/NucH family extracellular endonuclease [Intrasporangium sp.]|uniref:ExeM/NucH family extracellular endonuclease n=1 Tax=Intrasporangium sp. TaxID=1925024 RepID=UPI00293B3D61|nr:ExeM/NucH family extracellular endonuclease [Intrasporangium sp.]MDV3221698.1 ExeM/NucH family extracellular endonuclease [Intrasporangium sp.]